MAVTSQCSELRLLSRDGLVESQSYSYTVKCFTCVKNDFVQVSDTLLVPLEWLVVLLVEQHPQLHPKMHYVCYVAVVKVFVAVSHHGTAFPDFLSRTGQYHISLVL